MELFFSVFCLPFAHFFFSPSQQTLKENELVVGLFCNCLDSIERINQSKADTQYSQTLAL
jgi:hypothetical protein